MESLSEEELNRKYREALRIAGIGHLEGYTLQEQQDAQKRAKELKAELQRRELARLEEQLKRQKATEQEKTSHKQNSQNSGKITA